MLDDLRYREFVQSHGFDLSELGVNGRALSLPKALEALMLLRGLSIAVLGGDILEGPPESFRHSYENWSSEPMPGERFLEFCQRSQAEAIVYLKKRIKDLKGNNFVHLVTSDENTFSHFSGGLH